MERDHVALAIGTLLVLVAVAALSASVPLPEPSDSGETVETRSDARMEGSAQPPELPNMLAGLGEAFPFLREAFLVGLVLALAGALLIIRRLRYGSNPDKPDSGDDTSPDPESIDTVDETQAREEAERAAERISDPTTDAVLENEVYRAWYGMTRALGVRDPRSETPGRFAELAVRAGMDEDAVAELTALFNDVRYGERPLTDRDEERAVELLRRLAAGEGEE